MNSLKPNHFSFSLHCASTLLMYRVSVIEERFVVVSTNQVCQIHL
ncbi:hypothetical protein Hanom_Chr07g00648861 [Helianthus anomalus]